VSETVPGRQAERTALAWQRTGLSVAVAATVLARLTYGDLGAVSLLALAVCLGLCGWVLVDTRRRDRRRSSPSETRPGIGGWAAAVAGSVVVMGVAELAALVVR
jgi:putative membrane protein